LLKQYQKQFYVQAVYELISSKKGTTVEPLSQRNERAGIAAFHFEWRRENKDFLASSKEFLQKSAKNLTHMYSEWALEKCLKCTPHLGFRVFVHHFL